MQDKVLLISPEFFYYQTIFKKGIEELGFDCDWYSDRPSSNFATKAALRVMPFLVKGRCEKYLDKILLETKEKEYKYILVIMGEVLTKSFLKKLKERYSKSKFIYVFWDAIANFNMGLKFTEYFDKVYTTDRGDSIKYGYNFIPLFYNSYIDTSPLETKYDFSFVGTIKKGKNKKLNSLVSQLSKKYNNSIVYKYIQGKSVLLFYKIKYPQDFKKERMKNFKFKKMDSQKAIDIFKSSRFILDVPMNQQKALTERCFNAMYLGKKLITTNQDIINYDFYDKNNIYIYSEGEKINFSSPFFHTEFKPIENYEKYSLNNWLKQLLFK
ncbi:MAG: hypothetical protein WCR63_05805 [Bacilli bacterium]